MKNELTSALINTTRRSLARVATSTLALAMLASLGVSTASATQIIAGDLARKIYVNYLHGQMSRLQVGSYQDSALQWHPQYQNVRVVSYGVPTNANEQNAVNVEYVGSAYPPSPTYIAPPVAQPRAQAAQAQLPNLNGPWACEFVKLSISHAGRSFTVTVDDHRIFKGVFTADDKVHVECAKSGEIYDVVVGKNGNGKFQIAWPGGHVWTHE